MNELITEFYNRCSYKEPGDWPDDEKFTLFHTDEFAELIIRECISEIAMIGVSNSKNEDVAWAVDTAIKNIKNRFGIE